MGQCWSDSPLIEPEGEEVKQRGMKLTNAETEIDPQSVHFPSETQEFRKVEHGSLFVEKLLGKEESEEEKNKRKRTHEKTKDSLERLKKDFNPLEKLEESEKDLISKLPKVATIYEYETQKPSSSSPIRVRYLGQFMKGERHGVGTASLEDGSIYYGLWKKGRTCGLGILLLPAELCEQEICDSQMCPLQGCGKQEYYQGETKDDMAWGNGKYIHKDGSTYEGEWKQDLQEGKGKETWPNWASYEGEYKRGMKDGRGKMVWVDGSSYEGDFVKSVMEGKGKYIWADGRVYDGEWKEGKMQGRGMMMWPDGRVYEGEFVDDKKQGKGMFTWPDKSRFEGFWKEGRQDGEGFFTDKNGKKQAGKWKNGNVVWDKTK